jgi:hypothetical protein
MLSRRQLQGFVMRAVADFRVAAKSSCFTLERFDFFSEFLNGFSFFEQLTP